MDNTLAGLAVTVRIGSLRHGAIMLGVIQKQIGFAQQIILSGAYDLNRTGFNSLRTFGGITQHQNRLA